MTVTQAGNTLTIIYGTLFTTCKHVLIGTLSGGSFAGVQTAWSGPSNPCDLIQPADPPTTIEVTFAGGMMTGRFDRENHPTLASWDVFTLDKDP